MQIHNEFVGMVAEYREIDIEKVHELADGSSMPGSRALENNLVDSLGGVDHAHVILAELTGKTVEESV